MNDITELAKKLKSMETTGFSPMIGVITSLPALSIQLGNKVILDKDDVITTFDLYETRIVDYRTEYINLNKKVVLLPYSKENKFIAVGVLV